MEDWTNNFRADSLQFHANMARTILLAFLLSFGLAAQEIPAPPADVILQTDIEYSRVGGRMAMDVVMPREGTGPFAAVVCIHGGGFRAGNRESFLPIAYKLAQAGYVAATVSYRLSPRQQFPAAVEDVKAAVRFLRANADRFQIDPNRIGATGASAGGTLALMLGVTGGVQEFEGYGPALDQSSRVQAVVNFFGATNFLKSYDASVDAAEVLPMFLGGDRDHAYKLHVESSPLNWVSPDDAPTLTLHGTKDRYVAVEQGQWITERLRESGVTAEMIRFENVDHGFGAFGPRLDEAIASMRIFFNKHLAKTPQRTIALSDHSTNGEIVVLEWPSARIVRRIPNNRGHDVQLLPNGNILYTTGNWKRVIEVSPAGDEVWTYGLAEGLEHPIAAERLANGNTLIGDMILGKIIEVTPAKKTVWEYTDPELANSQMRSSRRTAAGTTLIAVERLNKIIEVDKSGKIIWTYQATGGAERFPYQPHRLPNGNTLIGLASPGEVIEVNPKGETVRSVGGADGDIRMVWCSGVQPLKGGGFMVSDYQGRRILEFNADWELVNEWRTGSRTVASLSVP